MFLVHLNIVKYLEQSWDVALEEIEDLFVIYTFIDTRYTLKPYTQTHAHVCACVCAWRVKHIACIQIDRGTLSEQMLVYMYGIYVWYIYIYNLCESVFVCKKDE